MNVEDAVLEFERYDRVALPVVNNDGVMHGIITADDVLEFAERRATREMQTLGGTEALEEPYITVPLFTMFRKRGVWLSILFVGQLLTATVMERFNKQLETAFVLTLFVPLIISSGGNSGSQATSLIIRALALREVTLRDWWKVLRREMICATMLGLLLGGLGLLRVRGWHAMGWRDYTPPGRVAFTVSLALVGVVLWGSLVGSMLPFLLRRVGLDPATSSAPFVATCVDVTGLIIYFGVASIVLSGTLL
jgi:magnesium transporter